MIEYALKLDFPITNNEAEYETLIAGLGLARAVRAKNLKVCGDSRLVVAQVNGEFDTKDDTMAKYLRVVKGILTQFDEWYAEHVPREENTTTNALSQFASSEIENYPRSIYFQVLKTPTIHVINLIAPVGVASCWIDPIKTHLETGWLPNDAREARKLSVRALRYSLIEDLLYKRSFVIPYLKCLRPLEAEEALKKAHEGICGQHLGGRALAHTITRLGFYWPTMLADAKAYVKKCDRCHRHVPIVRQPPERLTSISTPIPFAMWGMDILGPFPVASGQRKFIVVAIDYFTKWIEAKALAKITTKKIAQFFWENENGQAEVANRIILDGLKKRVERSRNTWVDELLPILWAYYTTCKVKTEATPFMLAYGAEDVVPLEITHESPRIEAYEPETNEEGMRLALDLIDEVRDEANARNAEHQREPPSITIEGLKKERTVSGPALPLVSAHVFPPLPPPPLPQELPPPAPEQITDPPVLEWDELEPQVPVQQPEVPLPQPEIPPAPQMFELPDPPVLFPAPIANYGPMLRVYQFPQVEFMDEIIDQPMPLPTRGSQIDLHEPQTVPYQ
ncbi:uncharacterized protein LOC141660511 [Apium graveolens]|uniref:uncharacterized protein LOC141660511 n=1 Tax=Apium graveolens TaxID=4045 RepID=UPI003D791F1E